MTQEEKALLERELSIRSHYGVLCAVKPSSASHDLPFSGEHKIATIYIRENDMVFAFNKPYSVHGVENIRPYLRPMSSMTEDEQRTLDSMCNGVEMVSRLSGLKMFDKAFDWLNAHHFDYRGLIEKGLAIEVTEENNPYNE